MDIRESKLYKIGIALLVAYVFVGCICRASAKPLWADEIIAIGLSKSPTLGAIWDAQEHAADGQPPTLYMIERVAGWLPFNERIAYRFPSILAFSGMVLCVALFISRSLSRKFGLMGAAILLTSIFFSWYGVEARGYAMMAGFTALAMICYQRAERVAWCALMGASLAAAEAAHYYAVFGIIPFGLAELAFFVKERRVRLGVWAALAGGASPLLAFWPLLTTFKRVYGAHYSGNTSLDDTIKVYGWIFSLPYTVGIGIVAAGIAGIGMYAWWSRSGAGSEDLQDVPLQERVLGFGFLVLPFVMYIVIRAVHGGFSPRYLLLAALGIPVAASYVLPILDRRALALFAILLFVSLGVQEAVFWRYALSVLRKEISPVERIERLVYATGRDDLPVLVSNPNKFFELEHYASPRMSPRVVAAVDPAAALAFARSDTADIALSKLRIYLNVRAYDFADFAEKHSEFLLYSDDDARWDWWPNRLLHDGYSLELVAMEQPTRIYLVRRKH